MGNAWENVRIDFLLQEFLVLIALNVMLMYYRTLSEFKCHTLSYLSIKPNIAGPGFHGVRVQNPVEVEQKQDLEIV